MTAWPWTRLRLRFDRRRVRLVAGRTVSGLAALLVWLALVAPDRPNLLRPAAFVRVPIEGLLLVGLAVLLPARPRRWLAIVAGALLGLLTVVRILDLGFFEALDRPFDPVTDWGNLRPAVGVLRDSVGNGWADAAELGALLLVVAVLALLAFATHRLVTTAAGHRAGTLRLVAGLAVVWAVTAAFGLDAAPGQPVAASGTAGLALRQVRQVQAGLRDQHTFAAALADDSYRGTPTSDLLTGLRGKDVVVAFVESYGRVAVQDSTFSPGVDAVLDAGTTSLRQAGFDARSAFLTSPTFGGISWLAHSTLQTGLWIDNQQRYDQVVGSDRFTLSDAFKKAGWRTVGDIPSNHEDWPEGTSFYHYDTIYDQRNVGYAGPSFSYASMPDQYTLAAFGRNELKPGHQPVMAEIDLVSSHTPWAPLPSMVGWDQVGNGSVFDPMPARGQQPGVVWHSAAGVRAAYGQSVQYSMTALVSWVEQLHDDNLVLVVLGDHQPATIVSGNNPGHDVPISIVAHDPAVLSAISGWGWQDGLHPSPAAPIWPMDTFRNRFLAAYDTPSH